MSRKSNYQKINGINQGLLHPLQKNINIKKYKRRGERFLHGRYLMFNFKSFSYNLIL
jgi:hypothetical protein